MKISRGILKKAQRVVIYGAEGIGKTTLASQFPNPLFIDTEGSSGHIDVARVDPAPTSWSGLLDIIREVPETDFATLVIDTADWMEMLCTRDFLDAKEWKSIEDAGFGKGYVMLAEEFQKIFPLLDKVIESGKNVVITAHAQMRKFEQPDEMGSYDRWEMKLSKKIAPLMKEWSDMLLFCNYKTEVVATDKQRQKHKATGGRRVIYTSHHPCWDAKNRHGLPDMIDLDYAEIAHCFPEIAKPEPPKGTYWMQICAKCAESGITVEQLQAVVEAKGKAAPGTPVEEYEDFMVQKWLFVHWDKLLTMIKENTNNG